MDNRSLIEITVAPKSSRCKIVMDAGHNIKVYLTDPPVDGKANAGLISLLSKTLKVPKSSIEILQGQSSKKKRVAIYGLTTDEIMNILNGHR